MRWGAIVKGGIFFKGRIGSAVAARDPTINPFFLRGTEGEVSLSRSRQTKQRELKGSPSEIAALLVSYATRKRKMEKGQSVAT